MQGYTGVYSLGNNYFILLGGKQQFADKNEAALEYDKQALLHYHECAILNFPDQLEDYRETFYS